MSGEVRGEVSGEVRGGGDARVPPDGSGQDPLIGSFLQTTYRVNAGPAGAIDIRVGSTCPALDDLLVRHGATGWAFITAWNPMSRPLPQEENRARAAQLAAELRGRFVLFDGAGIGDAGDWPPEESLLVLGIDEAEAVAIAIRYRQLAIVAGETGGTARLVRCARPG